MLEAELDALRKKACEGCTDWKGKIAQLEKDKERLETEWRFERDSWTNARPVALKVKETKDISIEAEADEELDWLPPSREQVLRSIKPLLSDLQEYRAYGVQSLKV